MTRVITYGTFDLLHYGHRRLLERARALGDYLIVGVTGDDFDKSRGKINVQQSLMERIEAVRATGLADEIIVEEYEGQKIDDIRRLGVDVFTVGSDWVGQFDYLNAYCKVVYLERTQDVSSSELRAQRRRLRLGLIGEKSEWHVLGKFESESTHVNGIEIVSLCLPEEAGSLWDKVDAVHIIAHPSRHSRLTREALERGKHVLCELPFASSVEECEALMLLAKERGCLLMPALKTAYSTAYTRLIRLVQSGVIGEVVSVDATCTSLLRSTDGLETTCNSLTTWGPTAMLPIFHLLGCGWMEKRTATRFLDETRGFDAFTRIEFVYPHAMASIRVGKGVKSEGELVISGTKGYVFVPAPWWKTDYFEIRYENPADNRRYFYQLDGEGIRYELVAFAAAIERGRSAAELLDEDISRAMSRVMEDFEERRDMTVI